MADEDVVMMPLYLMLAWPVVLALILVLPTVVSDVCQRRVSKEMQVPQIDERDQFIREMTGLAKAGV